MIDFSATIGWLDNAYRTRESDLGTLLLIAIGFSVAFLISKILIVLVEKIVLRKPLPWSGTMLSLLAAAAFWVTALIATMEILAIVSGRRLAYPYSWSSLLDLIPILLLGQFLVNPLVLIGLIMMLIYLFQPKLPRSVLVVGIFVTMAACCAYALFYNHNPDLARS